MARLAILAAVSGWLGFSVGWFFRKWLETRWVPGFPPGAPALGAAGPRMELLDWIDEQGAVLASLPRPEVRRRNLLHPVTATFVFHPDGRLFVQQRTAGKDVYPGLHDLCVGGTVVSGESFAANALREVAEELGIRGAPVYSLFQHRYQDRFTNSLIQVFACVHGGPVIFQPEEVAGGSWAGRAAIAELLATGRVCPDSTQGWRLYLERFGETNFARDVAPTLAPVGYSG